MMDLTDRARARLEEYCETARGALAARPEVDASEVLADIRAHVESALADSPVPVTLEQLESVLEVLGEPTRWQATVQTPPSAVPVPLDLATSGLALILAVVALVVEPLILPFAFLLARYRLGRGQVQSPEGWLLGPPLIAGAAAAVGLLLLWPYGLSVAFGGPGGFIDLFPGALALLPPEGTPGYWLRIVLFASVPAGVWWTVLGAITSRYPRPITWLLYPCPAGLVTRAARVLTRAGAALAIVATVLLFLV